MNGDARHSWGFWRAIPTNIHLVCYSNRCFQRESSCWNGRTLFHFCSLVTRCTCHQSCFIALNLAQGMIFVLALPFNGIWWYISLILNTLEKLQTLFINVSAASAAIKRFYSKFKWVKNTLMVCCLLLRKNLSKCTEAWGWKCTRLVTIVSLCCLFIFKSLPIGWSEL